MQSTVNQFVLNALHIKKVAEDAKQKRESLKQVIQLLYPISFQVAGQHSLLKNKKR